MSNAVTIDPALPAVAKVLNGLPVSGRDHTALARASNYVLGRGCTLIPEYCPNVTITDGTSAVFNFKVWPRGRALARFWVLRLRRSVAAYGVPGAGYINVTVPSGGTAQRIDVRDSSKFQEPVVVMETIATPTGGVQNATIEIEVVSSDSAATCIVEGIACYELPRAELTASEYGCNVESDRAGEPIYDASNDQSIGALADAVAAAETQTHRGALWGWSVPDANAITTSSGVLADIFVVKPRMLGTKIYRADTTKAVTPYIRAFCSNGTTSGEIVLTSRLGATKTISVPLLTTSATWISNGTLAIDCEDLTASDGRRSSAWEDVTAQWRRTAGAGPVSLSALIFGDG